MAKNPDKPKARRTGQRETIVAGKKYVLRVFLGKDAGGKRHYHSETFHGTAGQAEDRIREIIRRHRAGEAIKATADTFGSFLDEWIEAKRLSVAASSLATYELVVRVHIRPAFGSKMLARVTADEIQRFYAKLHADKLSRATIRYVHTVMGMIFKLAVKRKKLIGSPMAGVEIPKEWGQEDEDRATPAMTPEQVGQFLTAAAGDRFENLFKLAFHVGFRPGELLALKWVDLDVAAKTLHVSQNIVWRKSGDWYLKKPKTKLSRRTLPLTDAMIGVLKDQRRRQLEDRLRVGKLWTDHGFIFTDSTGSPYAHWNLYAACKRILKAAGLPENFTPYSARHTMATLLIAGGTNVKAVSERLGHSQVVTTLQQYTHVSPGMQANVSDEIERLLDGKK